MNREDSCLIANMSCVNSNHIVQCRGPASHSKLAMMLAFLFEMLKRTRQLERSLLALPLPAVLHCLLLVSESQGEPPFPSLAFVFRPTLKGGFKACNL